MIAFIRGTLRSTSVGDVIVEVNGIGYSLLMSEISIGKLPKIGSEIELITYLHVSDAGLSLFGFLSKEEEDLFKKLIAVNGIGPKMAVAALSRFTPDELIAAIVSQDAKQVSKIPGVGKKLASRMILELKDAFEISEYCGSQVSEESTSATLSAVKDALLSMGFTTQEIDIALQGANPQDAESSLLKYALKRLGS